MLQRFLKALPLLALVFAGGVFAQAYPTRPITMIVPFSAGGPTDTLARNLAQAMTKILKQTVVIEFSGAERMICGRIHFDLFLEKINVGFCRM